MNKVFLDHASTTPVDQSVFNEMKKYFLEEFANPSSIHQGGQNASRAIKIARNKIKEFISADNEQEIIFCSSGTEADNLAVKGVAMALKDKGNHIITSKIEHPAVLESCKFLEKNFDFDISYLDVNENGFIDLAELENSINSDTILISIMMANNEIGTIEPISEIGDIAKKHNVYFHSDAVQAAGKIEIDVNELNVDLLSLSAHKINGPKGIGVLYVKSGTKLTPQMSGGSQENHRRSSTENVPAIVGMGKAIELTQKNLKESKSKLKYLRDKLISGIEKNIDEVKLNGPRHKKRLINNVNFEFKHIDGEAILLNLDLNGIAASSGSACASGAIEPSHVLLATGLKKELAKSSIRFTLGYDTTEEDIDYVIDILPEIIQKLRDMSPELSERF